MSIQNLILNGGFETGNLTGWISSNTNVVTSQSHSGLFSARFANSTVPALISQTVSAKSGEAFEFIGSFAKFTNAPSPIIEIQLVFLDANNNITGVGLDFIIAYNTLPIVTDNNWNEIYQTSITAPLNTTIAQLSIRKPSSALNTPFVFLDDIALITSNGDGSTGTTGATGPTGVTGSTGVTGPSG
ncbi:hypothetical protein SAMN04488134_1253, partial [Amphibacillus marinus]